MSTSRSPEERFTPLLSSVLSPLSYLLCSPSPSPPTNLPSPRGFPFLSLLHSPIPVISLCAREISDLDPLNLSTTTSFHIIDIQLRQSDLPVAWDRGMCALLSLLSPHFPVFETSLHTIWDYVIHAECFASCFAWSPIIDSRPCSLLPCRNPDH